MTRTLPLRVHLSRLRDAPAVLAAGVLWLLMLALSQAPFWQQTELKLLDQLIVWTAPNQSRYPITVVGIDAESFAKLETQWPWPRAMHAALLERLAEEGASVVVFDVVFSEPSGRGADDDHRFASAIKRSGNVVLAADRMYRETAASSEWMRMDPLPLFLQAGAEVGLATVPLDPDLVVRQMPDTREALWRKSVLRLIRSHPELAPNLGTSPGSYIRYAGGDHTFPYVSYHEVVQPNGSIPEGYFKDQIVIVGFAARASPNAQSAQADLFHTPFLAHTGGLMPGAEVHANLIETALNRDAITRVPTVAWALGLALVAATSSRLMRVWRPVRSALWGAGVLAVVIALTVLLLQQWNLWFPVASLLTIAILTYLVFGGRSYLLEQARRTEITRAFSLYVTPQVVEHMIAHPEQMRLGGERRNITVLFTDLAGFTSISEALSPEQVAQLLNRHFTAMTDIILEHHGTVVSFIGDAIMAFWGAPLQDDTQAQRCVAAAVAMQSAMQRMRDELAADGLPSISMRVGIHSGSAVVGNLGSAKRFDYTAIGDDVNLAARLEGANKQYETEILVSGSTVESVRGEMRFRPIDKVIVKGKTVAVEVFTPCEDAQLIAWTTQAIERFRAKQWDVAKAELLELLAAYPGDAVAKLYLQRIETWRATSLPADWDGSVALDKPLLVDAPTDTAL